MTGLLEQRYRTVLRLLPASYRAEWEDELVATYLHDADESELDLARPELGEVASIAALAVRVRLAGPGGPPRFAALGSAVRTFAVLSLLLHAAGALTERALTVAWFGGAEQPQRALFLGAFTGQGLPRGAAEAVLWLLPLAWVGAYAALLRDRRRTAAVLAGLAALSAPAQLLTGPPFPYAAVDTCFALLTVAAVCCGHHAEAPAARLPFLPPGAALLGACVLMGGATVAWPRAADAVWGAGCAVLAAAAVWCAARFAAARRGRSPEPPADSPGLPLGLAALAAAVLAQRTAALVQLTTALHGTSGKGAGVLRPLLVGSEVQLALLAAAVAVLGVLGVRALPAPPRVTAGAPPNAVRGG